MTVNAIANFTAPVLLQSSLTANSLTLSGGLTVQGNTVLGSSSSNTLAIAAATTAASPFTVSGLFTASSGLSATGASAISGGQVCCCSDGRSELAGYILPSCR